MGEFLNKRWRAKRRACVSPGQRALARERKSESTDGSRRDARPTLWFMESLLLFFRMHWDHEPADRAVASWTAPVLWRFRLAHLYCQSARRPVHSKTWRG